ncbi:MAG: chemotaxis protein CheW [Armatimonadota bacterium]|nr:chemotaxis protein CheW [Armatimonadota bacterium]
MNNGSKDPTIPIHDNNSPQQQEAETDRWASLHERLERVQHESERQYLLSAAEKAQLLKERARALAVKPSEREDASECLDVLEFMLAHEKYAVEGRHVLEVYPLKELTPLPCTPSFVLGIINVRGQMLSVIDLKRFFGLPERGLSELNRVIIAHSPTMDIGILADAIVGVRQLPLTEIQPALPTLTGVRAQYLRGVTYERVVVLDLEKILSDETLVVQEEVAI